MKVAKNHIFATLFLGFCLTHPAQDECIKDRFLENSPDKREMEIRNETDNIMLFFARYPPEDQNSPDRFGRAYEIPAKACISIPLYRNGMKMHSIAFKNKTPLLGMIGKAMLAARANICKALKLQCDVYRPYDELVVENISNLYADGEPQAEELVEGPPGKFFTRKPLKLEVDISDSGYTIYNRLRNKLRRIARDYFPLHVFPFSQMY